MRRDGRLHQHQAGGPGLLPDLSAGEFVRLQEVTPVEGKGKRQVRDLAARHQDAFDLAHRVDIAVGPDGFGLEVLFSGKRRPVVQVESGLVDMTMSVEDPGGNEVREFLFPDLPVQAFQRPGRVFSFTGPDGRFSGRGSFLGTGGNGPLQPGGRQDTGARGKEPPPADVPAVWLGFGSGAAFRVYLRRLLADRIQHPGSATAGRGPEVP